MKAGYVIANVGCRSRFAGRNQDVDGNYIAHSPAQVVDVKAAIRYLRYNDAAMPGNTNRIIITGTSGGGALGVAIAASGNSPDYYPYLYELGAAGVTCNADRHLLFHPRRRHLWDGALLPDHRPGSHGRGL